MCNFVLLKMYISYKLLGHENTPYAISIRNIFDQFFPSNNDNLKNKNLFYRLEIIQYILYSNMFLFFRNILYSVKPYPILFV